MSLLSPLACKETKAELLWGCVGGGCEGARCSIEGWLDGQPLVCSRPPIFRIGEHALSGNILLIGGGARSEGLWERL